MLNARRRTRKILEESYLGASNGSQIVGLGDGVGGFSADDFDVAGRAHVGVDAAVGAVGAAVLLGGLVDLDVLDDGLFDIKTLGQGVALGILEQGEQELGALLGPATLSGTTPSLGLGAAADGTVEAAEGDALLLGLDVLQEALGLLQGHSLEDDSSLVGVLEVNAQVSTAGVAGLGKILRLVRVHLGRVSALLAKCRKGGRDEAGSAENTRKGRWIEANGPDGAGGRGLE